MFRLFFAGLLALVLVCLALPAPALAADPGSVLSLSLQSLVDWAATALATLLVAFIAAAAKKLFGLELDKRHRDTLHSALRTGAGLALSLIADLVSRGLTPEEARSRALQEAVTYVKGAAPDALQRFGLDAADGRLFDMLKSTATQLQAATAPLVLATPR